MTDKNKPIKILEEALKYEQEQVEEGMKNIKTLKDQASRKEGQLDTTYSRIRGLKDAIHKLKGLDNLEKKNIEERRPASMEKNLLRTETAQLYGRSIASYSKRELAAYIIHQSDQILKIREAKK